MYQIYSKHSEHRSSDRETEAIGIEGGGHGGVWRELPFSVVRASSSLIFWPWLF